MDKSSFNKSDRSWSDRLKEHDKGIDIGTCRDPLKSTSNRSSVHTPKVKQEFEN